jgi:Putative ATPase subunit of terminase (gpP-like)
MPAALDVDREKVQMLALTYGVREAARMLGLSEDTVKSWSLREGWVSERPVSVAPPPTVIRPAPIAPNGVANALQTAMKGDALYGRASALRVSRRALESIDKECSDADLRTKAVAEVAGIWIKGAATAGGYSSSDAVAKIDLRVTGQRSDVGAIEAEVVQDNGFVE